MERGFTRSPRATPAPHSGAEPPCQARRLARIDCHREPKAESTWPRIRITPCLELLDPSCLAERIRYHLAPGHAGRRRIGAGVDPSPEYGVWIVPRFGMDVETPDQDRGASLVGEFAEILLGRDVDHEQIDDQPKLIGDLLDPCDRTGTVLSAGGHQYMDQPVCRPWILGPGVHGGCSTCLLRRAVYFVTSARAGPRRSLVGTPRAFARGSTYQR